MKRLLSSFFIGLLLSASLTPPPPAHAQDATTNRCLADTYAALLKEMLFERSVIFGQKATADLPRGAILYDTQIKPWIKTGDNEWKTYDSQDSPVTNGQMESRRYPPKRRGILETKQALTSELIPSVLQTMRAMQCRLRYVCEAALRSRSPETPSSFRLQVDGCIEVPMQRIDSCRDDPDTSSTTVDINTMNVQVGVCDYAAEEMLKNEMSMITLVMSYDDSYRTFLQFAGITQSFGKALREPILGLLSDTVIMFQKMGSVPCFTAQCDE